MSPTPSADLPLDKDQQSTLRSFALLGHIGFVLGGSVLLGYWVGDWCDRRWRTAPWISVVTMLLFLAGGGRECWRLIRPLLGEDSHGRPPGGPQGR